jgi:hypothetical protein
LYFPKKHSASLSSQNFIKAPAQRSATFTFQSHLIFPYTTMSIPKTLVTDRQGGDSSSAGDKRKSSSPSSALSPEEPSSSSTKSMEPAKKLVRWSPNLPGGPSADPSFQKTEPLSQTASSSLLFKKRVDKMRQREESKRPSISLEDLSATELQEVMQRMEDKIHKIARKELAYLNQSKKLRDARTILTSRHQRLAQTLQQALRAKDPSATVDAPRLPPVLCTGTSGNPALIDLTE